MSTASRSFSFGVAVLIGLFAAGTLTGRALALPLPATIVGLALVLLGLRVGVMVTAVEESSGAPTQPIRGRADASEPSLRAVSG